MKLRFINGASKRRQRHFFAAALVPPDSLGDDLWVVPNQGVILGLKHEKLRERGELNFFTSRYYRSSHMDTFHFKSLKAFWRKLRKLRDYVPTGTVVELYSAKGDQGATTTFHRSSPPQELNLNWEYAPHCAAYSLTDARFDTLVRSLREHGFIVEVEWDYATKTNRGYCFAHVWGKEMYGAFINSDAEPYNYNLDGKLALAFGESRGMWSRSPLNIPLPRTTAQLAFIHRVIAAMLAEPGRTRCRKQQFMVRSYNDREDGRADMVFK